jgi:hypothetical protein
VSSKGYDLEQALGLVPKLARRRRSAPDSNNSPIEVPSTAAMRDSRLAPTRLVPSYFCTCWKATPFFLARSVWHFPMGAKDPNLGSDRHIKRVGCSSHHSPLVTGDTHRNDRPQAMGAIP